jgi:hypothetical protein
MSDQRLIVTLIRVRSGLWSWSVGDSRRQMEARQGIGARTGEEALEQAFKAAKYSSADEDPAGEA